MNWRNGKITHSEIVPNNERTFSTRTPLTLDEIKELLETIVKNGPLRSMDALHQSKAAIAELELKSGFHSILAHLRELERLRQSEVIDTIDSHSSNKLIFKRHMRAMIGEGDHTLTVFIDMPSLPEPEMIVNPPRNLESKVTYYLEAYDEDMRLKSNPNIRMTRFEFTKDGQPSHGVVFKKEGDSL